MIDRTRALGAARAAGPALAVALLLAVFAGNAAAAESAKPTAESLKQAVLVTGASAGIGRRITEQLTTAGYYVFAGARKEQDLKALSALPNVSGVRLDVTSASDVAAAVEAVRRSGRELHGIVNNAGVLVIDPVVTMRDEDFDFQMQVNVYGVFRVTKAFAPLVIAAKGRIVNISSISAFLSREGWSAYDMSKAAVEAFTDVLANEMAPLGVAVCAVEPGAYNTDILKPALERSITKGFKTDRSSMKPPDEVAAVVVRALTEAQPQRRYMIVAEQPQAERTVRALIDRLVQLNENSPFRYDSAALTAMVRDAAAKAPAQ